MPIGTDFYYPPSSIPDFRNRVMMLIPGRYSDPDSSIYHELDIISQKLPRPYDIFGVDTRRIHRSIKWWNTWRGEIFVIANSRQNAAEIVNNTSDNWGTFQYTPQFTAKHFLSYRYYCLSCRIYAASTGLINFRSAMWDVIMQEMKRKLAKLEAGSK